MNINFFANLFRLSRALGKGSHSILATTQKKSKDFLVTTITESFYLAMYFTFVAFLVGLSASLRWRYKDQLLSGFVRNNLPAVGNPSNEITWETFEHIGSKELSLHHLASQAWEAPPSGGSLSLLVESPLVERIDVYNDSFVIKPKTPWEKLRSQKYIGFYTSRPGRHQEATLGISLATPDVSHLPLANRAELADQLGPCSALTSSEWLQVPARGFVEFPRVGPLGKSRQKIVLPLSQALALPSPLLVRADVKQDPGAADAAPVRWETSLSQPLVHPLARPSAFADPAGLPETFNMGSYPLLTKPTLSETTADKNKLEAATGYSPGPSKDLIEAWIAAERRGRVSRWSPLRKWVYQFYGYLDEMPYKLDSTKLSLDDLAVMESRTVLVGPFSGEKQSTAPQLGDLDFGDKLSAPLRDRGIELERLGDAWRELEVPRNRLQSSPVLSPNSDASQHQLSVPHDATQTQSPSGSFQVGRAQPSRNWVGVTGESRPMERRTRPTERAWGRAPAPVRPVRPVGPGYGNGLIGVRVRDAFSAANSPRSTGGASPELGGATHQTTLPSSRSQTEVRPYHETSTLSKADLHRGSLSLKRQAFAKEAALLIGSDSLLWRERQGWNPLPRLLNELNSDEVVASIEEGVKALEEGWEELFALLNDSVSRVLPPIRPVSTRLMSGYTYPDSTRTKLSRDLSHWVIRHGFNLNGAVSTLLLAEREVPLPASPTLPLPRSRSQGPSNGRRRLNWQMPPIPIAEIDYLPVSLRGLASLRDVLAGLEIEGLDAQLDEIPMLELTYQGPAVARDKVTNDLVGRGTEELTAWVVKAIHGHGGGARSGALADLEMALSSRQGNRLGKKEVLRGEPLVHEKLLAGVGARTGLDMGVSRDRTEEARDGVEVASPFLQPMKSNKMAPERFLTGLGPKVKDPSQVLAVESGDEAPLYPLEIVLTKTPPLFEEEEEVLSLEPDEWRNIFKGVVVQAIENKGSLDKIEVLLPSIAVAHNCTDKEVGAGNQVGLIEAGLTGAGPTGLTGAGAVHCLAMQPQERFDERVQRFDERALSQAHFDEQVGRLPVQSKAARWVGGSARAVGDGGLLPPNPHRNTASETMEERATGLNRARPEQPDGRLGRGHLGDRHGKHWGQQQRTFGKAYELTRVLTSQEYTNLGILVAQSKRFVGECSYWPVKDLSAAEVHAASTPRLLCHYLPLSQVAMPESSAKQSISAGSYQKRLTSFTACHPFNRQSRSPSTLAGAMSPFPVVRSKQQMFSQVWEPVTANSWMMFYKLCFAFWIQEMGKDFYQRYGKEIILYALNLLVALGFDAQGMIEDLGLEESPMRVITNGARRFGDIAGIDSILPELGEIVWFLRSSGRGGQVPKGILLVGPPGTGKTFLVQAIAGEARVPVIVQSASSLRDSGQKQSGSQKLRDLFDRARQLSPCILFMDEIDTLGVSRPHVIGNTMGADELLESIEGGGSRQEDARNLTGTGRDLGQRDDAIPELDPYLSFLPSPRASRESMLDGDEEDRPREEAPVFREGEGDPQDSPGLDPAVIELIESHNEDHRSRQERLALLMQFLMEMDGLRALHGVVVIGATNRPAVLDPAFTRPGRFEKVLCLQLPGKQKRIEILKLYSRNLGLTDGIPTVDMNRPDGGAWEYLANRTAGWSAAHLAAAMNQSAIRAIIQETAHTIETVEHGIGGIAKRSFQASQHPSRQILSEEGGIATKPLDTPFLVVSPSLALLRTGGLRTPQSPNLVGERDSWWASLSVKLPQARTGSNAQEAGRLGAHPALSIARWAYYQAGKAVLQTALPLHPPAAFLPLQPQPFAKSSSDLAKLVASTAQQGALEPHRRAVLETRLVGLYAGKAAEMLAFSAYSKIGGRVPSQAFDTPLESLTNHEKLNDGTWASQSDLGIEELTFAGVVANSMITSWYLYSKRVALQEVNLSTIARNVEEIDDPVLLDLLRHLEEDLEHQVERATRHPQRFQQWASPSWWQTQVMAEASLVEPGYSEWYRIYIPDPEETERNIDWVPPEDHYHAATANRFRNLSRKMPKGGSKSTRSRAPIGTNRAIRRRSMGSLSAITWNDFYLINRDYIYHGLINSCFQKAFLLLDQRRELVDFLSDHLIRYDLLRQYEIEHVSGNFGLEGHSSSVPSNPSLHPMHPIGMQGMHGTPNRSSKRGTRPTEPAWGGEGQAPQASALVRPERPHEAYEASAYSMGRTQSPEGGPGRGQVKALGLQPQDRPERPEGGASTELAPVIAGSATSREGVAEAPQGTGPQVGSSPLGESEVSLSWGPSRGGALPPRSPYVVEPGWGFRSRRRISRFIDFDFVKPCYLKRLG